MYIAFSIFQLLPAFSQQLIYAAQIIQDFLNKNFTSKNKFSKYFNNN